MKSFRKILALLCVVVFCAVSLSACGKVGTKRDAYKKVAAVSYESGILAENEGYELSWDDGWKTVLLKSKTTGKVWGTTPYSYYTGNESDFDLRSPITIEAVAKTDLQRDWARSFPTCIESAEYPEDYNGSTVAEKIENGIRVTYYFNQFQISVPVCYELREDSVVVSLDTTKITEGTSYQLWNVSLTPFFASVANDSPDSYLFVPSGNGALMYPDTDNEDTRTYTGEIYGRDRTRMVETDYFDEERVKMPVFGVKDGKEGLLAIAESGEEAIEIVANAGNYVTGYSNVYAKCYVRGHDIFADEYGWGSSIYTLLADYITDQTVSIAYYPLSGENAGYVGMANRYRQYLIDNGLVKSQEAQSPYALSILGNVQIKALTCGVPYHSTDSMTSFKEAKSMITELQAETGLYPSTQLVGYGKTGIDYGKICGGYAFAGCSGKDEDYHSLVKLARNNHFLLSTDFETMYFDSSGAGVGTVNDVAKSASHYKSEQYYNGVALREFDEEAGVFYLVSREKLSGIVGKLSKEADKLGVSGINLSSMGRVAYSDYAKASYFGKKDMATDVAGYIGKLKKRDEAVTTDDANAYAAAVSDTVFNVDVTPQYLYALDEYIPFYSLVFKGYKPLYSEGLNLTTDYEKSVAQTLSCGIGLGYTLIDDYNTAYIATPHGNLYNTVYGDHREKIVQTVTKYRDFYAAVGDSGIKDYSVTGGLATTTYENGVVAYTNLTASALSSPAGELAAYTLKFVKGGAPS